MSREQAEEGDHAAMRNETVPLRTVRVRGFVSVLARVAFGGLFVFSGVSKLQEPQLFGFALKSLHLGLSERALIGAAFVLPWWEVVAGSLLVLGLWRRAAAAVIFSLLIAFTVVIAISNARGIAVDCPCFGAFELVCTGPLGVCHLVRNLVLALFAAVMIVRKER